MRGTGVSERAAASEPRARLRAEGASARSRRSFSGGGNGARRRSGARESVSGSPRGEAPRLRVGARSRHWLSWAKDVKLMGRVFVAFGFIVCLQAMTLACSSRVIPAAVPVPPQPDRPPEPPSPVPSTPKPPPSPPAAPALGPQAGSADCALIAEAGEPVATVALSNPIDPTNALHPSNESERLVFRQVYETLVRIDCEGRVAPALADSWRTPPFP